MPSSQTENLPKDQPPPLQNNQIDTFEFLVQRREQALRVLRQLLYFFSSCESISLSSSVRCQKEHRQFQRCFDYDDHTNQSIQHVSHHLLEISKAQHKLSTEIKDLLRKPLRAFLRQFQADSLTVLYRMRSIQVELSQELKRARILGRKHLATQQRIATLHLRSFSNQNVAEQEALEHDRCVDRYVIQVEKCEEMFHKLQKEFALLVDRFKLLEIERVRKCKAWLWTHYELAYPSIAPSANSGSPVVATFAELRRSLLQIEPEDVERQFSKNVGLLTPERLLAMPWTSPRWFYFKALVSDVRRALFS